MGDQNLTSLLRTKLYKPQLSKNHLHRQHLIDWLNKWTERPLTLVSAPAGYGKSTLLSYWLKTSDIPNAWISLDSNDNDIKAFLPYLLEAVQSLFPDSLQNTKTLLYAPNLPPLKNLAYSLINELDQINQSFILVLDDYHFINDQSVHGIISELLQHPPLSLHLVLSSRFDPPFGLGRLRARRQMGEIRVQDLCFSSKETGKFLEQEFGKRFDDAVMNILEKKVEGWATGLRLTILSMQGRTDLEQIISHFPLENRYITDYLITEVISNLPRNIQDYLLSTSILDRFNASLCDSVCSPGSGLFECKMGGTDFLKWLETSELFVVHLDDQGKWYRYHHLFQKFLLRRLKEKISQEDIYVLYLQASQWFADKALINEAIQYSLAGKDTVRAAKLVEQNKHIALNQDRWYLLEKWMKQLPDKVVQQRPKLLIAKAWVLKFQFKFSDIPPLLSKAGTLDSEYSKEEIETEINLLNGLLLYWEGKGKSSMEVISHALGKLPETSQGVRNDGLIYFAIASQMSGEGEAAAKIYQKKIKNISSEGTHKLRMIGSLVFVYLLSGELIKADETNRQLMEISKRLNNKFITTWSYYLQGIIHYQWYNLEKGIHCFSKAVENEYLLSSNTSLDSYAGLILSYQASQQYEKASDAIVQMIAFAKTTNSFEYIHRAYSIKARLQLLQGHLEKALQWEAATDFSNDTGIMYFWLDVPRITQCRILTAHGSEASLCKAEEKLLEYLKFNRETHTTPQIIETLLLLTMVYKKQGKINEAMALLAQGVNLALPGKYLHAFISHLPEIADLLKKLSMQSADKNFIRRVLQAADAHKTVDDNPLSCREIEVLSEISQGLTNKDVADKLYISPETVKKHTKNIYQKLGVNNRQHAVFKANNLRLLG